MSRTKSKPRFESIEEYLPETFERDWGREVFFARTPEYLGKILYMNAGTRGGLQCHVEKMESFHLFTGRAEVEYDPGDGLVTVEMVPGQTFHIPPKAVHRVTAITDCIFLEASTSHLNDRFHCEAFYGLADETGGLPSTFAYDEATDTFKRVGG